MAYLALYRAWRPQRFDDVVGQEHVRRTLQNALSEGRLAHAYLFSGPRGTGKTSMAKILAKAVNCERGPAPDPCNECATCRQISEGRQLDVVEIDAASHRGVDEIRELRDKVKYAPTAVRYKVYIIDEVHMLTTEAFNALLKTLEEPPPHVLFILATTEPHKIPVTILSRCQRFDFSRLSSRQLVERLRQIVEAQGIEAAPEALQAIAHLADGGMRDALSLLDQVISFSDGRVTEEEVLLVSGGIPRQDVVRFWQALSADSPQPLLELAHQWLEQGKEPARVLEWLFDYGRWLLLSTVAPDLEEVRERQAADPQLAPTAARIPVEHLLAQMDLLRTAVQEMKWVEQPRIFLELTLLKLWRAVRRDHAGAGAERLVDDTTDRAAAEPPPVSEEMLSQLLHEVRQLRERVRQLEARLDDRRRGSSPTAPEADGAAPAAGPFEPEAVVVPADDRTHKGDARRPGQAAQPRSAGGTAGNGAVRRLLEKSTPEMTRRVQQRWPEVLQQVRKKRIFVHAWLVDGEVVAASNEAVLLAFRTAIHRETTEKAANRQLIETVMRDVLGEPATFVTVMQADWERLQREPSDAEPACGDEGAHVPSREPEADPVVQKALEWFGDAVEIKRSRG